MDSRFAALADRYAKGEPEPEQTNKCMNRFDSLITGEHDYNWSKVYEKADSTVYFVEKNLIKEYIDSQHADEGDIKIQQTIQNTALSGDTCW